MDIKDWIKESLPEDYAVYLRSGGVEQTKGNVLLYYGSGDLVERNVTYEVQEFCPGFITIGDDGGGQAVMLKLSNGSIHLVSQSIMAPEYLKLLADNFSTWLSQGCCLLPDDEYE